MKAGELIKDHYIVEAELGRGSFGEVVRARHPELANLKYAIKLLHEEARRNPEFVELFFREARILSELDNPHVCRIQEFGYTGPDRTPFLVMELLQGESLAEQLERGAIKPELAVVYMLQICDGLGEAHAHDVIHRDLKPANIFVTRTGKQQPLLKVLDFGVAKGGSTMMVETLSNTTSGPGTILYMSPEQLLRPKDVTTTSDIWALGAILHELVTGVPPFTGDTTTAVSVAILQGEYARVPDRARALQSVIDKCLQRDAKVRFASTAELTTALEHAQVAVLETPGRDISSAPTVPRPALDAVLDSTFKNSRGEMQATVSATRWRMPAFAAVGVALTTIVVLALSFGKKHPTPSSSMETAKPTEAQVDAAIAAASADATATVVVPPDAAPVPNPAPVMATHVTHATPKLRPKTPVVTAAPIVTQPPALTPTPPPASGSATQLPKINTVLH